MGNCLSHFELLCMTQYHRLSSSNSRHVFPLVLERGKTKINMSVNAIAGESFLGRGLPSSCIFSHDEERESKVSGLHL